VKKDKFNKNCIKKKKSKCTNYCKWDNKVCVHKCDTKDRKECKNAVNTKNKKICDAKKINNPDYNTCLDKNTET